MAQNKNIILRYKILDKILSTGNIIGLDALLQSVNLVLPAESSISRRTLIDDLGNIENLFNIEIERRIGVPYRYKKSDFRIFYHSFNNIGVRELERILMIARQHSFYKNQPALLDSVTELIGNSSTKDEDIILLDHSPPAAGTNFLVELYRALVERQPIKLYYKPFFESESVRFMHPYFLKEYKYRWYIFGWRESSQKFGEARLENLALDRIVRIEKWDTRFDATHRPRSSKYFENFIGITLPSGKTKQNFLISTDLITGNYWLSKPLHHSQNLISKSNKCMDFGFSLIPNFEWEQLLFSFGAAIEVKLPSSFRKIFAERSKAMASLYGD